MSQEPWFVLSVRRWRLPQVRRWGASRATERTWAAAFADWHRGGRPPRLARSNVSAIAAACGRLASTHLCEMLDNGVDRATNTRASKPRRHALSELRLNEDVTLCERPDAAATWMALDRIGARGVWAWLSVVHTPDVRLPLGCLLEFLRQHETSVGVDTHISTHGEHDNSGLCEGCAIVQKLQRQKSLQRPRSSDALPSFCTGGAVGVTAPCRCIASGELLVAAPSECVARTRATTSSVVAAAATSISVGRDTNPPAPEAASEQRRNHEREDADVVAESTALGPRLRMCSRPLAVRDGQQTRYLRLRVVVQNVAFTAADGLTAFNSVIVDASDACLVMRDGRRLRACAEPAAKVPSTTSTAYDARAPSLVTTGQTCALHCSSIACEPIVVSTGEAEAPLAHVECGCALLATAVQLEPLAHAVLHLAIPFDDADGTRGTRMDGGPLFEPDALWDAAYLTLPVRAVQPPHAPMFAVCLAIDHDAMDSGYAQSSNSAARYVVVDEEPRVY